MSSLSSTMSIDGLLSASESSADTCASGSDCTVVTGRIDDSAVSVCIAGVSLISDGSNASRCIGSITVKVVSLSVAESTLMVP